MWRKHNQQICEWTLANGITSHAWQLCNCVIAYLFEMNEFCREHIASCFSSHKLWLWIKMLPFLTAIIFDWLMIFSLFLLPVKRCGSGSGGRILHQRINPALASVSASRQQVWLQSQQPLLSMYPCLYHFRGKSSVFISQPANHSTVTWHFIPLINAEWLLFSMYLDTLTTLVVNRPLELRHAQTASERRLTVHHSNVVLLQCND